MIARVFRRHPDRYQLHIDTDTDLSATGLELDEDGCACFEWGVEPPEGVSRTDYEQSILRESKLLVESAIARAAAKEGKGTKVAGEGQPL